MKNITKTQLIISMLLAIFFVPFNSYGADKQIEIKSSSSYPILINQPGSYLLIENITVSTDANCIQIGVPGVIIDLGGLTITGPGPGSTAGAGIYGIGGSVINGTIRNFGKEGVRLNGNNCEVRNVRAIGNGGDGIYIGGGIINNCTVSNNGGSGINGNKSSITNCTAIENGKCGIYAASSSVSNCTAYNNSIVSSEDDSGGICAYNSSVINCTANDNDGNPGIIVGRSTVINCVANGNKYGISGSEASNITNCMAVGNTESGFSVYNSNINNSRASGNWSYAIHAHNNCRMEGNYLTGVGSGDSSVYGLYLDFSHNYAIKNVAWDFADGNHFYPLDNPNNYIPIHGEDPTNANANYAF